jgi:hypothetical protein
VCVCVFQYNFNFGKDSFQKDILLQVSTPKSTEKSFTPYVLHASRNILIFIGQREKYSQQYKSQSISPFKPHPPPFTKYLSAKHKNIFWNYSVVFVYLSSISIFHGKFSYRSLFVRHCRISRCVDRRK